MATNGNDTEATKNQELTKETEAEESNNGKEQEAINVAGNVISTLTGKRKKTYKSISLLFGNIISKSKVKMAMKSHIVHANIVIIFLGVHANGTKSLWRHLDKCPKYSGNKDKKQKLLNFSEPFGISSWNFNQELCRKELARMIIVDELPFCFVEKEGFKRFMSVVQPKLQVISRKTVRKDCVEIFSSEKQKLMEIFQKSISQVCLTTDLWTSIQNLGYMCLTAHFIDENWVLQKRIINFHVLPTPHRGENIAQSVETCMLGWGIEKVLTITVDNASSNDVAISSLKSKLNRRKKLMLDSEMLHIRCFGHVLNLIVRDGLGEVGDLIIRIRESVKYVRSSPSRLQIFKKLVEEERITSKRALCIDVQTRWNSTYLMLSVAIEYQKVFERLEDHDVNFVIEAGRKHGIPTEQDWEIAKNLHKFLEFFYEMTNRVSGSKYVTSNSYFHEVYALQTIFLKWSESEDKLLQDMIKRMKAKFDKYCNIQKMNPILIIVVVLDPRYKLMWVEYCFLKFYSIL